MCLLGSAVSASVPHRDRRQRAHGCAEHPAAPERVEKTNWFFRLSRYQWQILELLECGQVRVGPTARRNEALAFVRAGLRDISVSRPAARAGGWSIPVPDDPGQTVYVWWDALANYVTALGDGAELKTDADPDPPARADPSGRRAIRSAGTR
jgi:methionyl-tRNA synthetase